MHRDKIIMSNMAFFGTHGVLSEENKLGQKFFVDVDLYLDTKDIGTTDNINKGVSYADVYSVIKVIMEEEEYNLLETLCEQISSRVLNKFVLIDSITVRVKKPEAPVPGIFDYFGVEIWRERKK